MGGVTTSVLRSRQRYQGQRINLLQEDLEIRKGLNRKENETSMGSGGQRVEQDELDTFPSLFRSDGFGTKESEGNEMT